jgi:hypothetical protein
MGAEEEPDAREELGEGLWVVVRLPGLTTVGPPQLPPPHSRSKLLLTFMMFFAILPDFKQDFKCNFCPKTLGKAKQAIKLR